MLCRLELDNFKSFASAEAPFGPFTVLVGANASGKTNVIEALRFLSDLLGEAGKLDTVLRDGGPVRGGTAETARLGSDTFSLRSRWSTPSQRTVQHELSCAVRPVVEIRSERVSDPDDGSTWLRATKAPAHLTPVDGGAPGPTSTLEWPVGNDPAISPAQQAVGARSSLVWSAFRYAGNAPAREVARRLCDELSAVRYLDITPSVMRGYIEQEVPHLDAQGAAISPILFRLCQDADQKRELVDWLSALCAPELADIEFSRTEEGSVMLRLIEKDGTKVSARSLSDGTLRFLGELTAVRTAPRGSVLLMEELGRDVHPRRMHLLVQYLESAVEERGIQIIATTHSPDVLEALSPRSRADAIVLGRVPSRAGTLMRRLGDLTNFEEVVTRRGLASLFTMGWLEDALEQAP